VFLGGEDLRGVVADLGVLEVGLAECRPIWARPGGSG
jgi:hypothetical protein